MREKLRKSYNNIKSNEFILLKIYNSYNEYKLANISIKIN